jgi:hypothetical protein
MRRTDWADEEARRLFEMVRNIEDDEKIIYAVAGALRRAAYDADKGLLASMHGPVGQEFE